MTLHSIVPAAFALMIPVVASAQPSESLEPLQGAVKKRQQVVVTDTTGRKVEGKLVALTGDALVVERTKWGQGFGTQTIDLVQTATVRTRDSIEDGLLIGLGAGYLVGLAFVRELCPHDPECAAYGWLYVGMPMIAGGAAIGAGIDFAFAEDAVPGDRCPWRRFYRTDTRPTLGGRRAGLEFLSA